MLTLQALQMEYPLGGRLIPVLKGIQLDVAAGEFFTLLGPSGCGKTTALRSVAGLETPTGGSIRIDDSVVFDAAGGVNVPPNRREISMVFQSYAIWPHMTVGQNVAFPLETMPLSSAERDERVRNALEMVGLGGFVNRPAPMLSGGQQQRVALARALVKHAKLLLLDEPLSNLDAKLREQMRDELRQLHHRVGTTAIYVTHDQDEALAMSDRIALIREGTIVEIGTPENLYLRPKRRFTAEFLGRTVVLAATPSGPSGIGYAVQTPIGKVTAAVGAELGERVRAVVFRPDHIQLREGALAGDNAWPGRVTARNFSGRLVDYTVTVGDTPIPVQTGSTSLVPIGADVTLSVPVERCVLLDE
ncbi:MAG TPA: ABC transporter ATP-binding protein [Casimicrobiaceae bacterium]|nr:ABC transporter ATP-binding protein [Casimicrobiaceae bacterium]